MNENYDYTQKFTLTAKQCQILYSIQNQMVLEDIQCEKDEKKQILKKEWREAWEKSVILALNETEKIERVLWDCYGIKTKVKEELEKSPDKTWYYLAVIETIAFVPYFQLDDSDGSKYRKLKYKKQLAHLKTIIESHGIINAKMIDRIDKNYTKAVSRLSGRDKTLIIAVMAAIGAAVAAYFAPQIAVLIIGKAFPGLGGAALTSACLATMGGGAIAVGGFGMSGGVAIIAGGGLLLGGAMGGVAVGCMSQMAKYSPSFTVSQAAKLEIMLKEVVLNVQKDIFAVQTILKRYRDTIDALRKELIKLKLDRESDKKEISNLKKSIEILEKAYENVVKYTSCFEEGMIEEKEKKCLN